jgi:hypothetical protein
VSRDFLLLVFFHESVFPQPQSNPLEPFRIFSKIRGYIHKSRFTTGINDTNLPPVSATPVAKFFTIFPSVVDTGGKYAPGVKVTGGKFAAGVNMPPVSTTPAANLPPVSTTPVANNGNNYQTAYN